ADELDELEPLACLEECLVEAAAREAHPELGLGQGTNELGILSLAGEQLITGRQHGAARVHDRCGERGGEQDGRHAGFLSELRIMYVARPAARSRPPPTVIVASPNAIERPRLRMRPSATTSSPSRAAPMNETLTSSVA